MLPDGKRDARSAYIELADLRRDILRVANGLKASALSGTLTGYMLVGAHNEMINFSDRLAAIAGTTGLQAHKK